MFTSTVTFSVSEMANIKPSRLLDLTDGDVPVPMGTEYPDVTVTGPAFVSFPTGSRG